MDLASLPVLHAAFFVLGAATVPFSAASTSILVLFAGERLGLGLVAYGVLLSSLTVEGVLGALSGGRVAWRLGAGTTDHDGGGEGS